MTSRLEATVDRIMGEAYERAWIEVERRVRQMMSRNPKRFKSYRHAIGWGPMFLGPDGKTVEEEHMNARERKLYAFLIDFYDRYGGNNALVEL